MFRKTICYNAKVYQVLKDYGNETYQVQLKSGSKKLKLKLLNDRAFKVD